MARPELPAVIAEIAEIAGPEAAWALARAKGGTRVFIPAEAKADHWLVELVGIEAARRICAHYRIMSGNSRMNGVWLLIPMAAAARSAERWTEALSQGLSIAETALRMGVHERTVSRRRAEHGRGNDKRQGTLF